LRDSGIQEFRVQGSRFKGSKVQKFRVQRFWVQGSELKIIRFPSIVMPVGKTGRMPVHP